MSQEQQPLDAQQNKATEESAGGEAVKEPTLSPLQRVKAQQAALQKNRQKGARKAAGRSEEAGPGEGPHQRVQIQRRSGGA